MKRRFKVSNRALTLTGSALVAIACTLGVPSKEQVFGTGAPVHPTENGGAGGALPPGSGGTGESSGTGGGGSSSLPGGGNPAVAGGGEGGTIDPGGGDEGGQGGDPGVVVLPPAELLIHYTFDDISSFVAVDSSGNGNDGTLTGTSLPVGDVGHLGGAIKLDGTQSQYVALPPDLLAGREAVSVAVWVKLGVAQPWDRLFDFSSSDLNWFYFSPTGWNFNTQAPGTHCAVRNAGVLAPEIVLNETLSVGLWHHVAVVFAPPYLRYYLDGALKSEISNLNLAPRDVGQTHQNWIGRSVYPSDPYLSALVDDFRFYSGALDAEEIDELATQ